MELKTYNTYIFTGRKSRYQTPFKGKVVELTRYTILIHNLDADITFRECAKVFSGEWEAVELVKKADELQ